MLKKKGLQISKNLERLKLKFGGVKNGKIPDVVFIVDLEKDKLGLLKEAIDIKNNYRHNRY